MLNKIKKLFILIVVIFITNSLSIHAAPYSFKEVVTEMLNSYDVTFLGTEYYAYMSTQFINDALFNGGTSDFSERMVYQFAIDQYKVLKDILDTHTLEWVKDDGRSIDIDSIISLCMMYTFAITDDSDDKANETLDTIYYLLEFAIYDTNNSDYFSDLSEDKKLKFELWARAMQANMRIIQERVYGKTLSYEDEQKIFELPNILQSYYTPKEIEKIHIFNTICKSVQNVYDSKMKTRDGRKFRLDKIKLYYFK